MGLFSGLPFSSGDCRALVRMRGGRFGGWLTGGRHCFPSFFFYGWCAGRMRVDGAMSPLPHAGDPRLRLRPERKKYAARKRTPLEKTGLLRLSQPLWRERKNTVTDREFLSLGKSR